MAQIYDNYWICLLKPELLYEIPEICLLDRMFYGRETINHLVKGLQLNTASLNLITNKASALSDSKC